MVRFNLQTDENSSSEDCSKSKLPARDFSQFGPRVSLLPGNVPDDGGEGGTRAGAGDEFLLGFTTVGTVLPKLDGTVGQTSKGVTKFYANNWRGNQHMAWIGRTNATRIAKPLPYIGIPLTVDAEISNIRGPDREMKARGTINVIGALAGATSVISEEPDSTVRTPSTNAQNYADEIISGDWLRNSTERD